MQRGYGFLEETIYAASVVFPWVKQVEQVKTSVRAVFDNVCQQHFYQVEVQKLEFMYKLCLQTGTELWDSIYTCLYLFI